MRIITLMFIILQSGPGHAEFSATERSINGTGETLTAKSAEAGLGTFAYGISDDLLLSTPTLTVLTGNAVVELRRRFTLPENVRISPAISAGTPVHFGARLDAGIDLGSDREHSFTLSAETDWAAKTALPVKRYAPNKSYRFTSHLGGEYDFYVGGNLAYLGYLRGVPYIGYTWAWQHFHAGLITSNRSRFIPVPYFYWRF